MKAIPHISATELPILWWRWACLFVMAWVASFPGGHFLRAEDPFAVQPFLQEVGDHWQVRVHFEIPDGHYLYAERIALAMSEAGRVEEFDLPTPMTRVESITQAVRLVHAKSFDAVRALGRGLPEPLTLVVQYQGCDGENCFMPRVRRWRIGPGLPAAEIETPDSPDESALPGRWSELASGFRVVGQGGGRLDETEWSRFLAAIHAQSPSTPVATAPARPRVLLGLSGLGLVAALVLAGIARRGVGDAARLKAAGVMCGLASVLLGLGYFLERARAQSGFVLPAADISLRAEENADVERLLAQALGDARRAGRRVLVIFWSPVSAPSVEAVRQLRSPALKPALEQFTHLWLQADDARSSPARELCAYFSVRGFPAYLVLAPKGVTEPILGPGAHCEPGATPVP